LVVQLVSRIQEHDARILQIPEGGLELEEDFVDCAHLQSLDDFDLVSWKRGNEKTGLVLLQVSFKLK
jgi:hypothetical protein